MYSLLKCQIVGLPVSLSQPVLPPKIIHNPHDMSTHPTRVFQKRGSRFSSLPQLPPFGKPVHRHLATFGSTCITVLPALFPALPGVLSRWDLPAVQYQQ
jgi:hypothetical protein